MTQPTPAEQLLNLADRAERGQLTGDEAARLRNGINLLAELLHDAEGDRDSWARDAKSAETDVDRLQNERHTYQRAWHSAQNRARKERTRAERAEAAIERLTSPAAIRAAAFAISDYALTHLGRDLGTIHIEPMAEAGIRAALDPQEQQT